jgi:hypothetical protein
MAMSASGLGRDIVFRLRLQTDANDFDALKKLANETDKARRKLDDDHARSTNRKKTREEQLEKWSSDVRLKSAQLAQQLNVQVERERKASETRVVNWREKVWKNSIKLQYQEELRAIRALERERLESMKRSAREAAGLTRQFKGGAKAAGGLLEIGRGLAYSGLIGEQNTQTILNTLLAVESGTSLVRGGTTVAEGLVAAGLGSSATTAAAGLAAVAAAAAAAVVSLETIRDAGRYGIGGGSAPGSVSQQIGGGWASAGAYLSSLYSDEYLKWARERAPGSHADAYAESFLTGRAADRASRTSTSLREMLGRRRSIESSRLDEVARLRPGGSASDLTRSLTSAIGDYRSLSPELGDEVRDKAVRNIRSLEEQILRLQQDQLSTARQTARERINAAEGTRSTFIRDLTRFDDLDEVDKRRLAGISAKRRRGEMLSKEETDLAAGFHEFAGLAESSAVARAKLAGADFIFEHGLRQADMAARRASEATAAVARAELSVKQAIAITVDINGDGTFETRLDEELARIKAEILKDQQSKLEALEGRNNSKLNELFRARAR